MNLFKLKNIFAFTFILSLISTISLFGQTKFDYSVLQDPIKNGPAVSSQINTSEVFEYRIKINRNCVYLKAGLRSSTFENKNDWTSIKDSVEPYRIDIVYSKYPLRDGKYNEIYPLLFNRIRKLFEIDPNLNSSGISWNKILQTNCTSDNQVGGLFHGVVIWYHTEQEVDSAVDTVFKTNIATVDHVINISRNEQSSVEELEKTVDNIKSSDEFPDSLLRLLEGRPLYQQMERLKKFLQDKINSEPDVDLSTATTEELIKYNKLADDYLNRFPTSDSVVSAVLNRHLDWQNMIVVNDWTGSMYPYGAQVLKWQLLNYRKSGLTSLTLFNDGDNKPDHQKEIGNTGGIYSEDADNIPKLVDLFNLVAIKGNGGDIPENDVEAILKAIEKYPECTNVVLIADHNACVKDIELADRIKMPVKVILCGYNPKSPINPDYVYLAKITGGGIYTIEEDIENLQVSLGERGEIISFKDTRFKLNRLRCNSIALTTEALVLYTDLKQAEHKKHDVYMLDLSGQGLDIFPKQICRMTKIFFLNLSNNNITEIPPKISKLIYLKNLNLSNNQIKNIPEELKEVRHIENLDLSHNELTLLPAVILRMGYLLTLDVSYNNINSIDNISFLRSLLSLNMSNNSISTLPKAFWQQTRRLTKLNLSDNNIIEIQSGLCRLIKLQELNLENNQLTHLPEQLYKLKKLKILKLKGNNFAEEEKNKIRTALPDTEIGF